MVTGCFMCILRCLGAVGFFWYMLDSFWYKMRGFIFSTKMTPACTEVR